MSPVYSVQPTDAVARSLSTCGWQVRTPSFFYPTAAFSSPGMPNLLRRTLQVSHDFS